MGIALTSRGCVNELQTTDLALAMRFCECDGEKCFLWRWCGGCNPNCSDIVCPRPHCAECNVICRRRENLANVVADTAGADWGHVRTRCQNLDVIPANVPQMDAFPALGGQQPPDRVYALALRRAFTDSLTRRRVDIRSNLGLSQGTPLLLAAHGEDWRLHRLWEVQHGSAVTDEWWENAVEAGFTHAIAPDFSIWSNAPRAEHIVQMKRTLVCMRNMQLAGLTAVPNVFFFSEVDRARWLSWLEANPGVGGFAFNFQCLPRLPELREGPFTERCNKLRGLVADMSWRPRLLAVGVLQPKEIAQLATIQADMTIINGRLYCDSYSHAFWAIDGDRIVPENRQDEETFRAFEHNLALLDAVCAEHLTTRS